jgi:fumarate reductase subunit C
MSHARPVVDAMKPSTPGATRTAPPRRPDGFPNRGNYRSYIAFGAGGFFLFTLSFLVLRAVWAIGEGEAAWSELQRQFQNPLYVLYHALAFLWLTWFILRLFRLFPATQPKRIGPFRRPPDALLVGGLSGAFVVVTLVVAAILGGAL